MVAGINGGRVHGYLRTNQLSDLVLLTERINDIKNKIKKYKTYPF